jgi:hypothetical protein
MLMVLVKEQAVVSYSQKIGSEVQSNINMNHDAIVIQQEAVMIFLN